MLPLWSGLPGRARQPLAAPRSSLGALVAAARRVLRPPPRRRTRATTPSVFVHHTFGYQFGRDSPFSLWDWRQYHAKGLPDLHCVQHVLQAALVVGALALYRWPRRRSPLQMAAFTGALLIGFEMVLTHWSWLYLPWFFPFVAFALLAPRRGGGAGRGRRGGAELAGPRSRLVRPA